MKIKKLLFIVMMSLVVITLGACSSKTYDVKFDLNYENATSAPKTQEITAGEKATEPIAPVREGYEFKGWYEAKAETPYDFSKKVTKDITLYAKWEEEASVKYYLAGSFNNYVSDDKDFLMEYSDGVYTITVELTEDNRDTTYDGHYYKVTDGTWNADGTWGISNYYIDPAPQSPTGGGLGSIWHWADGTLTVTFDPETKEITDSLTIKEDIIKANAPTIYGAFNNWATEGDNAFILTDEDEDGIFNGTIEFTEPGESDFNVLVSQKWFDDQWGQRWGAHEQYKLDGTIAGMGNASNIEYEVGKYLFIYDSNTHITTYYKKTDAGFISEFDNPRLYGAFNGWDLVGENAVILTDEDEDGVFIGTIEFAEAGSSDFTVVVSQLWYDDQWGQRWGAHEQYKLDGTPAGMGDSSNFEYEIGSYEVRYDSGTKITTITEIK